MTLTHMRCTDCGGKDVKAQRTDTIQHGEQRPIYACDACGGMFSSPSHTPMAHLTTPLSVIVQVLAALTDGGGINAATRLSGVSKKSIYRWPERLSGLKKRSSGSP
jgi:transposase-like protein